MVVLIACLLQISFFASNSLAATPEQVDAAIAKATAFIYSQQKDGLWETHPIPPTKEEVAKRPSGVDGGQWGGVTALAVYALLAAGESPNDPRLVPAIQFLHTADIQGTYALGLRAQMYPFLPPSNDIRREAQDDAEKFRCSGWPPSIPRSPTNRRSRMPSCPRSTTSTPPSPDLCGF